MGCCLSTSNEAEQPRFYGIFQIRKAPDAGQVQHDPTVTPAPVTVPLLGEAMQEKHVKGEIDAIGKTTGGEEAGEEEYEGGGAFVVKETLGEAMQEKHVKGEIDAIGKTTGGEEAEEEEYEGGGTFVVRETPTEATCISSMGEASDAGWIQTALAAEHLKPRRRRLSEMFSDNDVGMNVYEKGSSDDYELGTQLGIGSFGAVFEAHHKHKNEVVAIKIVRVNPHEDFPHKVANEIKVHLLANSFRFVVQFKFWCQPKDTDDEVYMVLECCPCGSLEAIMENRRIVFTEDQISAVMYMCATALVDFHAKNVLHRDIKPGNILLRDNGEAVLADFGESRVHRKQSHQRKTCVGTIAFMAPEIEKNMPHIWNKLKATAYEGKPADVWSLGMTVLQLGTDKIFDLKTVERGLISKSKDQLRKVTTEWGFNFSNDFLNAVFACVTEGPSDRHTAEQLLQLPFLVSGQEHLHSLVSLTRQAPSKSLKPLKERPQIVVCAIALDEGPYVHEWLYFHKGIGFDHVYLYDNSQDNVLAPLSMTFPGFVSVIHFPGAAKQMPAYNDCLAKLKHSKTWCAFIDVDEFIVLRGSGKKIVTIHDLIAKCCPNNQTLSLNWVFFGSNGLVEATPEPVLKRFSHRQRGVNHHVKSIVFLPDAQEFTNPHFAILRDGKLQHDCHGHRFQGPFNSDGQDDVACVHHYFTKSANEFRMKVKRGNADGTPKRDFAQFEAHDFNEEKDIRAWEIALQINLKLKPPIPLHRRASSSPSQLDRYTTPPLSQPMFVSTPPHVEVAPSKFRDEPAARLVQEKQQIITEV